MSMIESVEEYGDQWVKWWTAAQPEWRGAEGWPFPQDNNTNMGDWGQLFVGGKDGLFIVIMPETQTWTQALMMLFVTCPG